MEERKAYTVGNWRRNRSNKSHVCNDFRVHKILFNFKAFPHTLPLSPLSLSLSVSLTVPLSISPCICYLIFQSRCLCFFYAWIHLSSSFSVCALIFYVHNSAYVYHAVYVSTRSAAFSIIPAPLVNCLCFCVALLLSLPFAASLSLFLSRPLFLSIALFRCSIWKLSNRLLLSFGL